MGNDTTQYTPAEAREPTDRICGSQGVDADDAQVRANTCNGPPYPAPDGYVWCKTIGDGWHLVHTTAGIGEWAGIVESGLDYLHGVVLRYEYDAHRTDDGTLWLRYGCEAYPVAEWRKIVADLCRFHEPERAAEYERAICALLDFVETVFGKEVSDE